MLIILEGKGKIIIIMLREDYNSLKLPQIIGRTL